MSLDPTKLSRFGRSRARTGCLTCVKRHVKCDEGKPSCLKCVRAGRVCESRPDRQSSGHLRIVQYVSKPNCALTSWPLRDVNELRYFDFFRHRTVTELSGAHSKELWSTLTLQVATTEPAIWHAVLALAAVHEQFVAGSSVLLQNVNLTFAMAQYGRAINTLMASIQASSYVSKDTPLLACALFCAFESLCYHLHSALSHITSGLKLLLELEDTIGTAGENPRHISLLLPLFTRLDTQRLQLGDSAFLSDSQLRPVDENLHRLRDFGDIQYAFDRLLNRLHHEINAQELDRKSGVKCDRIRPPLSHLVNIVSSYRGWRSAFDRLVRDDLPLADLPSVILLQLWRVLVDIMLCLDLRQGELAFDWFEMEFDMIVRLAERFLRLSSSEFRDVMASQQPDRIISNLTTKQDPTLGPMKRHCTRTRTEHMRSGFLGIHPSRTPLIKEASGDSQTAIQTTENLLHHRDTPDREPARLNANSGSSFMKPSFSFSHGIVYPLWVTITRCRNVKIRSAAWKLMVLCNRREGLWDSELSAKLGLRIIQIENARTLLHGEAPQQDSSSLPSSILQDQGAWIPNEARIRRVKPTFLANRKSIELYYLGWSGAFDEAGETDEVWFEDHIEW